MGKDRIVMNRQGKHHREKVHTGCEISPFQELLTVNLFSLFSNLSVEAEFDSGERERETQLINLKESHCIVTQEKKDEMRKARLPNNAYSAAQLHFANRGLELSMTYLVSVQSPNKVLK